MTTQVTSKLIQLLAENGGAPFLFIGSGFSRRYIALEQWNELLARFCTGIRDFGFYSSQNNQDLPKAAAAMAADFNEIWWTSDEYELSRKAYSKSVGGISSALKYEISKYLKGITKDVVKNEQMEKELEALSRINVDGIITTNWDLFLEELFPDYKVFVGQEELLFSNPQSIAEIYKIHGCSSQPNSLVLTSHDYEVFEAKNPYLAAKLITIFIEHPIIFIGYSISDRNIQKIIESIVNCLGQDKLDVFGRNLIFIQRSSPGEEASFQASMMAIGEARLNITVIKTNDFLEVYEAIETTKRKIPARILRYCKEQMYDLVKSNDPETKLAVLDIDQIENKNDVEFVVGVGVAKDQGISLQGYKGVTLDDIFLDIIESGKKYSAADLLREVYPALAKRPNKYIPGYCYLREVGINSMDDLNSSEFSGAKEAINRASRKDYKARAYFNQYKNNFKNKTTREIINEATAEKATLMIPFQADKDIDIQAVREFFVCA